MAADWMLIDGSSVMFRAFFGIPVGAFKAPDGQPVNAVRGFLDMLARLITDRKPRAIVVATDEDWRPAFRVDVIPSYKTARFHITSEALAVLSTTAITAMLVFAIASMQQQAFSRLAFIYVWVLAVVIAAPRSVATRLP